MSSRITDAVIEAMQHCRLKAYFLLRGEKGIQSSYEKLLIEQRANLQPKAVEKSRSRRMSSFRGLPQSASAPNPELSRLRLAKPPPSKSGSLARTCGDGKGASLVPHLRWSKAYRRG